LASIGGIYKNENEIEFVKKYHGRDSSINYHLEFNKEKNLWLGEFNGIKAETGRVMCNIISSIDFMILNVGYISPEE